MFNERLSLPLPLRTSEGNLDGGFCRKDLKSAGEAKC